MDNHDVVASIEDYKRDRDARRVWAKAALEGACRDIATTPKGCRDTVLTGKAWKIAFYVNEGYLGESEAAEALFDAAQQCGLVDDDGERVVGDKLPRAIRNSSGKGTAYFPTDLGSWTTTRIAEHATVEPPALAGKLLTPSMLDKLPDPEPLIGNVLDQGTVALLYGTWGTGKTFIALDWACSVATGKHWQSRDVERRRVLYVAAEGAFGLKGRVNAWQRGWAHRVEDGWLDVLPQPVNLFNHAHVVQLGELIRANGYGLVVIDTLARCMVGAEENSAKDCGQVLDNLTWLRDQTPAGRGVILAVHHTGKDGKTARGSSVFEAGADTVYSVTADGGVTTLEREKRKDGPPTDHHALYIDPVPDTGSCVMSVSRHSHGVGENGERTDQLILTFSQHFSQTGASAADLRKMAIETARMSQATYYRARDDLLKQGKLINVGTAKRPFYMTADQ